MGLAGSGLLGVDVSSEVVELTKLSSAHTEVEVAEVLSVTVDGLLVLEEVEVTDLSSPYTTLSR